MLVLTDATLLANNSQHCWANNVGSCCVAMLGAAVLSGKDTGFKLCAITPNNMQTGVQTNATGNIQHFLELFMGNNVPTVCTGLNFLLKKDRKRKGP